MLSNAVLKIKRALGAACSQEVRASSSHLYGQGDAAYDIATLQTIGRFTLF